MDSSNSYFDLINYNSVLTLVIGGVIFYIGKFYYKTRRYPNGPFPLPVFGNLFNFAASRINSFEHMMNWSKIYGPVYTFWMSSNPIVVITDLKIANEGFSAKRNDLAGRPQIEFFRKLFQDQGANDTGFNDYGPKWEGFRKVTLGAARKYSSEEQLALLVKDVVSETVDNIMNREGIGKAFVPIDYIYLTLLNILASSAFGVRYSVEDKEFLTIKSTIEAFDNGSIVASDYSPPLVKLYFDQINKSIQSKVRNLYAMCTNKYEQHQSDYREGIVRDFTDAMIFSQQNSLKSEKEPSNYSTNTNLGPSITQLFLAGTNTSNITLRWALLFMAYYPEMQRRMRKEIENNIGDRMPVQDDKNNCHFINAFISECLRHRIVAPTSVPRRALCDVEIGGYKIPKDTTVILHTFSIMHNPQVFDDPETFKPERFLDSKGHYLSTRHPGFIPFGLGKRSCVGEKLALAYQFLIITNLLQLTSGYEFVLPGRSGTVSLSPALGSQNCYPNQYKVMLKKVT